MNGVIDPRLTLSAFSFSRDAGVRADAAAQLLKGDALQHALSDHKPAAAMPTWWRLTLTLHQGVTVIRNVIVKPSAKVILSTGWFEVAANGDEFAVGYDAIATVSINGFSGPMPGGTL